jgi:hypothetical protein
MSGATQEQLNDLLLKKILGSAWTNVDQTPTLEASGSSMTKIPASLIMNQEIPVPAPVDLVNDATYTGTGTRKISTAYPHIQQYTNLTTTTVTPGTCFNGANTSTLDNQLAQAIPFNYDPTGGYSMAVYVNNVYQPSNLWYFDGSSGYLTFFNSIGLTYKPTISFWRYAGTYGLVTGSTGSTGSTGPQGSTGNQGNQGSIGPQGFDGYQGNTGNQGSTGPQGQQGQSIQGEQGDQGAEGDYSGSTMAIIASATAAAGGATAALAELGFAATAATAAGGSATAAGGSATAAGLSATEAAGSATAAEGFADSAIAYGFDIEHDYKIDAPRIIQIPNTARI